MFHESMSRFPTIDVTFIMTANPFLKYKWVLYFIFLLKINNRTTIVEKFVKIYKFTR